MTSSLSVPLGLPDSAPGTGKHIRTEPLLCLLDSMSEKRMWLIKPYLSVGPLTDR